MNKTKRTYVIYTNINIYLHDGYKIAEPENETFDYIFIVKTLLKHQFYLGYVSVYVLYLVAFENCTINTGIACIDFRFIKQGGNIQSCIYNSLR